MLAERQIPLGLAPTTYWIRGGGGSAVHKFLGLVRGAFLCRSFTSTGPRYTEGHGELSTVDCCCEYKCGSRPFIPNGLYYFCNHWISEFKETYYSSKWGQWIRSALAEKPSFLYFKQQLCLLNGTSVQAAQMGQQAFHPKVECNSEKDLWKENREKRITY